MQSEPRPDKYFNIVVLTYAAPDYTIKTGLHIIFALHEVKTPLLKSLPLNPCTLFYWNKETTEPEIEGKDRRFVDLTGKFKKAKRNKYEIL